MVTMIRATITVFEFQRSERAAHAEIEDRTALRHQVTVLRRQRPGRLQLSSLDRFLWVWLYRIWPQLIDAMVLVEAGDRRSMASQGASGSTWRWRSRRPGRPKIDTEIRDLIRRKAFPWDTAPRYLLRDRDKFERCELPEVITAPRSPWQNPYAERLIGSIRRECLDHVIILSERHLRRVLSSYFRYHHDARTHLSLNKDCPRPRRVQLPSAGNIIAFPEVGGLHHRYERRAA